MFTSQDEIFLSRTIDLAYRAGKMVKTNPQVGSLIVVDGKIIAEGWHQEFGSFHAERNAIISLKDKSSLSRSTLYVSLEPCNHHGKTPPCTDIILQLGIPRVVVGCLDPNPQMAGKSIQLLKSKGVEVLISPNPSKYHYLIRRFIVNLQKQRPYIIIKYAKTIDDYISAINHRTQISNEYSKYMVHKIRSQVDGVLIGTKTAMIDDPILDNRYFCGLSPIPIVIDLKGILPKTLKIFQNKKTILITTNENKNNLISDVQYCFLEYEKGRDLSYISNILFKNFGINTLLIEGGSALLQSFFDVNLWDECYTITGNLYLKGGITAPKLESIPILEWNIGTDVWRKYSNLKDY